MSEIKITISLNEEEFDGLEKMLAASDWTYKTAEQIRKKILSARMMLDAVHEDVKIDITDD